MDLADRAHGLRDLLLDLLKEDELRRCFAEVFGEEVCQSLPVQGTMLFIFDEAVRLLERRGLTNRMLFERLAKIAPGRRRQIVDVASHWRIYLRPEDAPEELPEHDTFMGTAASSRHINIIPPHEPGQIARDAPETPRLVPTKVPRAAVPPARSPLVPLFAPPVPASSGRRTGRSGTPLVGPVQYWRYTFSQLAPDESYSFSFNNSFYNHNGNRLFGLERGQIVLAPLGDIVAMYVHDIEVFVLIQQSAVLKNGDRFMIGTLICDVSSTVCGKDSLSGRPIYVVSYTYNGRRESSLVPADGLLLGREADLPGFAENMLMSRSHARLFILGESLVLADNNSSNGTFLVDRSERIALRHGTHFFVEEKRYVLEIVTIRS